MRAAADTRWSRYARTASAGRTCLRASDDTEPHLAGMSFRTITTSLRRMVRLADVEHFVGAGMFLDEHLTRDQERWREGNYLRFYLGAEVERFRPELREMNASRERRR
jgi:hypothetical protein